LVSSENLNAKVTGSSLTAAQYNRLLMSSNPTVNVHRSGSTYYAKKTTGSEVTLYSDTDFADLMNYIIPDLWDGGVGIGGLIHLRTGRYVVNDTIDMRTGIFMEGEGRHGSDNWTNYLVTALVATTDKPIISIDNPSNAVVAQYHIGLKQMILDGDGNVTTEPIIDIQNNYYNCGDVWLDQISTYNGRYGLRVYNNNASYRIWNVYADWCQFEMNDYAGVYIEGGVGKRIFQCRFTKNHFFNNNRVGGNGAFEIHGIRTRGGVITGNTFEMEEMHGIYMAADAHHWTIGNNIFIDCGESNPQNYDGIHLAAADYNTITGNTIANILTGTIAGYGGDSTENTRWAVYIAVGSNNNTVVGNTCGQVRGGGTGSALQDLGAGNTVANNVDVSTT